MKKGALSICIVAPHFAEYSERLASGIAMSASTLLLVNAKNRSDEVERPIRGGARVVAMPMDRTFEQAIALVRCLIAVGWTRPDVVIVQEGVRIFLKPFVAIVRRMTKVALIVHDPRPHSGNDSAIAGSASRQWLRNKADMLIVHGAHCRDELMTVGADPARVISINHGVLMAPAPDQANAVAPEPGRVLMFGRMEGYKGLEVLLDAVDLLTARGAELRLVVAGAGPEQTRLGARMAAMPCVEVINRYLSPSELRGELARASFVVAPYLDATQSGVLASTLANGRPVIASAVGGLGDVIHEGANGLLVPPGDAQALAAAMARLLSDPALTAQLAQGAQATAANDLDWATIAHQLLLALGPRVMKAGWQDRLSPIANAARQGM